MSRCYPFPPPGYVKNAPSTIDFAEKKEKRKHKDKKKKTKKHSAKDGASTEQENLREGTLNTLAASDRMKVVCSAAHREDANERLQAGSSEKDLVSIATKEVASSDVANKKRWQAASASGKEAVSSAEEEFILRVEQDTNKGKWPTINARVKGVPNGGITDHEKLHASSVRTKGRLPNGGIAIDLQRLHPRDEVFPSSKPPRLQEDNLKRPLPSNAKCESPEQTVQADVARNKLGAICVLVEKKRKSLEQDSRLTINGNRPEQRVQKGGPGHAAPNNNTTSSFERLQAQRPASNGVQGFSAGHEVLSNSRDTKKLQADSKYSSAMLSHGARPVEASGTTVGPPTKSGRPDCTYQRDDPAYGMLSNGFQAANSERPLHRLKGEKPIKEARPSNGVPAATKRTRVQADLEAGNLPPTKHNKSQASGLGMTRADLEAGNLLPTKHNKSQASGLGRNQADLQAGNLPSTKHNKLQASGHARIQADFEACNLSCGVPPTKHHTLQASNATTGQVLSTSQVLAPDSEHRTVQAANAKRDTLSNGMDAEKKEVLMNGGRMTQIENPQANIINEKALLNSVRTASGGQISALRADSHGEKMLPNGIQRTKPRHNPGKQILPAENIANGLPIACNSEGTKPSSSKISASDCNGGMDKDINPACKLSLEPDYVPSRQYLAQYMPHVQEVMPNMDDEDWLFGGIRQAQGKAGEMVEGQGPQVWGEARLLKSLGIHALPYVVAD